MLSGDAEIPVIEVAPRFHTVSEAEKVLSAKIKRNAGKIEVTNADQNMPILIQANDSLDEAASERAITESTADGTSAQIHAAALLNIETLLQRAKLGLSHRDWHTYAKNQQGGTNKETALQIHRFFSAMQYGNDLYGVKMTVREKRSGKNIFYTLGTHDLEVKRIAPETESSRGGVAKAALPVQSPGIKYSAFFEKFKPLDDLLGFKYKEQYPEVRFSLASEEERDAVASLRPIVGRAMLLADEQYAELLQQRGFDVTPHEAHLLAHEAMVRNQTEARRVSNEKRDKWLYENVPMHRHAVDFAGPNYKIILSDRVAKGNGRSLRHGVGIHARLFAVRVAVGLLFVVHLGGTRVVARDAPRRCYEAAADRPAEDHHRHDHCRGHQHGQQHIFHRHDLYPHSSSGYHHCSLSSVTAPPLFEPPPPEPEPRESPESVSSPISLSYSLPPKSSNDLENHFLAR